MSRPENDDDKTKGENNATVVNAVLDSKNSAMNKTSGETANTIDSKQNIPNSLVHTSHQNLVPNIREHIVAKAAEFLVALPVQNQNVYTMERKYKFLQSKGLTDQEIQASFQRASAICNNNPNPYNAPQQVHLKSFPNGYGVIQTPVQSEGWFIRLLRSVAYAVTVLYFGYNIYKNFIEKWLFGSKTSALEKRFEILEQSMHRCITLIEDKNISNPSDYIVQQHQIDQIRAELKSIKSLLLNRSQFPSAPATSGIPLWQLAKTIKPQTEQQTVGSSQTPSPIQQKTVNGVHTLISAQPIQTERRTNGIETLFPTQTVEEKGTETTSMQQLQNMFYDHINTSRELNSSDENASGMM